MRRETNISMSELFLLAAYPNLSPVVSVVFDTLVAVSNKTLQNFKNK